MNHQELGKINFNVQKTLVVVSIVLLALKFYAWFLTDSVAILSDALESIVNVVASFIGLYSLYISALPRDSNHPYGHGKIELISAAIEGILIFLSAIFITIKALVEFQSTQKDLKVDIGILIIGIAGVINFGVGFYTLQKGKKNHSTALKASGKHLISDSYTTLALLLGLLVIYLTNLLWLDSIIAILLASILFYQGYKIIRESISGIMDEADGELLAQLVEILQANRKADWIDIHNLRCIKYGSIIHIDCHVTLPYYLTVQEAHDEIENIDLLIRNHLGNRVELFIHTDPCQEISCKLCAIESCEFRKHSFESQMIWTVENMPKNQKHQLEGN
jgi:cation diffusion facilitator family transporter